MGSALPAAPAATAEPTAARRSPTTLTRREIKAMNPGDLKDALKERGLAISGNKKALIERLIDHDDPM